MRLFKVNQVNPRIRLIIPNHPYLHYAVDLVYVYSRSTRSRTLRVRLLRYYYAFRQTLQMFLVDIRLQVWHANIAARKIFPAKQL